MQGSRWASRIIAASFVLFAGCDRATTETPDPEPATAIRFVRDAATCSGGGIFELSVDGAIRDTVTLFPGDASDAFDVLPGNHEALARRLFVSSGLTQWGPSTLAVAGGETRTFVMGCGSS